MHRTSETATLPDTLIMAAEQVALVQLAGPGVDEVVADKGYHSDETLVALGAVRVRSHASELLRDRRSWQDKKTAETRAGDPCCAEAVVC